MWVFTIKRRSTNKNSKKQEICDIYKKEIDKACFQHDMAYGDFKDLPQRTASDKKQLRDNHNHKQTH